MPQPPAHIFPPHPHYIHQHHPLMSIPIPPSILKKTSAYVGPSSVPTLAPNKEPPGVPPFPPPDLSFEDEDSQEKVKRVVFIFVIAHFVLSRKEGDNARSVKKTKIQLSRSRLIGPTKERDHLPSIHCERDQTKIYSNPVEKFQ